jgi:hypothetical protein
MTGIVRERRPYRIHDERTHLDLPWRSYKDADRAIDRALSLLWRLEVGNTFTVYDERSSRAVLQVTRKVNGLVFYEDRPGTLIRVVNSHASERRLVV